MKPRRTLGFGRPDRAGKTTFQMGLARLRRYVLVLDLKGGDRMISKTGWPRITEWPLNREERHCLQDNPPTYRRIVGSSGRRPQDYLGGTSCSRGS